MRTGECTEVKILRVHMEPLHRDLVDNVVSHSHGLICSQDPDLPRVFGSHVASLLSYCITAAGRKHSEIPACSWPSSTALSRFSGDGVKKVPTGQLGGSRKFLV